MRARATALMAATTILVPLGGALAAPPGSATSFTSFSARPGFTASCADGASCTGTSTADGTTGRATAAARFVRSAPAPGEESVFAYGAEWVVLKVPQRATKVTVRFTWDLVSSTASASSGQGEVAGYTGLFAYAPACAAEGAACSYDTTPVYGASSYSSDGLPSNDAAGPTGSQVVALTVSGTLPRHLLVTSYPYAVAAGDESRLCLTADVCQTVSADHAGSSEAAIEAVLQRADVTYG